MPAGRIGTGVVLAWTIAFGGIAPSASPAELLFPSMNAPLYVNENGPAVLGSLTPGTPLTAATAPQGSATRERVTVEGWSPKGGDSVIYQAPNLRIILARLEQSGLSGRTVLGQQQDSYGTTWQHVRVSAWVAKSDVVPNVSEVWTAAKTLYDARCSSCHALHNPGEFTANQWPSVLRTMAKNAALDPAQVALVTKYLQAHARAQ